MRYIETKYYDGNKNTEIKIMSNFEQKYTEKQKQQIIKLFTRGLRKGEKVVDNRDKTIAKETNINQSIVCKVITNFLDNKFNNLNYGN